MKAARQAKTRQLKDLNCTPEDFFLLVQLVCGPPDPKAWAYDHDRWAKGIKAWCIHTEDGRRFTQCVTSCGEAKSRANVWYHNYRNWWLKENKVSYNEWRYGEHSNQARGRGAASKQ